MHPQAICLTCRRRGIKNMLLQFSEQYYFPVLIFVVVLYFHWINFQFSEVWRTVFLLCLYNIYFGCIPLWPVTYYIFFPSRNSSRIEIPLILICFCFVRFIYLFTIGHLNLFDQIFCSFLNWFLLLIFEFNIT